MNVESSLRLPTVKVRRALSPVRVDEALVLAEYWMAWTVGASLHWEGGSPMDQRKSYTTTSVSPYISPTFQDNGDPEATK
jgi:hypothetical protein